jgi:hypothetical protein
MKVYEAIAMLEQMDPTKEVTVTFGPAPKLKNLNSLPTFFGPIVAAQANPHWVIGSEQWTDQVTMFNKAATTGPLH